MVPKRTANETQMTLLPDQPAVQRLERLTHSGLVVIRLDGEVLMSFAENDAVHHKYSAVLAARNQWARQTQIAKAWGVSRRSVVKWIAQYRRAGLAGFMSPGGRPKIVTDAMKRGIVQLREQRAGIDEISAAFDISRGSVCEVLYGRRRLGVTPKLPGLQEPDSATAEQQEARLAQELPREAERSGGAAVPTDVAGEPAAPSSGAEAAACTGALAAVETPAATAGTAVASGDVDPLDRKADRLAAYLGLIEESPPLFAEHDQVEGLGSLLALAQFLAGSFLDHVKRVFVTLGPAFYGLYSVFITLFLMAVQRIRNPERLDGHSPLRLGRLLGLDRSPSVKTLRAKLKALAQRKQAANLMNRVAQDIAAGVGLPGAVLYVDGHVQCFYGKDKVGQVFSTSKNRVVKGATDYWVNLPDGTPLLCLPTAFNEPLNRMLPAIVLQAQKICGHRKLTVAFDRGGADAATYEWLLKADCDLIAYHKNPDPVDRGVFQNKDVVINGRHYAYAPYEREVELKVFQGRGRDRRDTGRVVRLREIIIRRADDGTTHVMTTLRAVAPEKPAGCLFGRWTQENFFKYMLATYELDHLYTYAKRKVPAGADHPNPEYVQLQKQCRRLREQIGRVLGRNLAAAVPAGVQQLAEKFTALHKGKTGQNLARLARLLADTTQVLAQTPPRESTDDYVMIDAESRLLGNLVKCAAYRAEGALAQMVTEVWRGVNGNQRGIVDAFMKTSGALRVEPNRLRIILQAQSTPTRTRILEHLCRRVSALHVLYPGTTLRLSFEVAPP